ncbi:MAG TPA: hypothetical protein VN706_02290 [Gemmatimonadaceae bacterium]|nr:hypothetical protein [Gemmatimonadaceae bacterium]
MSLKSLRRILVAAAFVGIPGIASAQFTTFIPPKNKAADSVKAAVAVQQQMQSDSISHAQIANMRTWVDSAAGVTPAPVTAADSLSNGAATTSAAAETTTFRNGTRAPATASDLPLFALIGTGALLLGTILLRGGTPARDRA